MQALDPSSWMSDLGADLASKPMRDIWIPGTHDTLMSDVSKTSFGDSCDSGWLDAAVKIDPGLGVVRKWATTQTMELYDLLQIGIRYFDIRLYRIEGSTDLRWVGGSGRSGT